MAQWESEIILSGPVSLSTSVSLSPIYTAENVWHGSDEKSTRTKKIGSARIDLVV